MQKIAKLVCQDCNYSAVVNGIQPPGKGISTAVAMQCPDCQGWNMTLVKSLKLPQLPEEKS